MLKRREPLNRAPVRLDLSPGIIPLIRTSCKDIKYELSLSPPENDRSFWVVIPVSKNPKRLSLLGASYRLVGCNPLIGRPKSLSSPLNLSPQDSLATGL
ncbi:hypothetical protein D3C71_1649120 [compost metagenome]